MPHPSYQSDFDHPNNIWQGVQMLNLLVLQLCPASCYFVSHSIHSLYSSRNIWHQVLHTYKRTGRIIVVDFEDWTCITWQSLALHGTTSCICNLYTASLYSYFFLKYLMCIDYLISSWSVMWKSTSMIPSSFAYVWS
jgi:hypothetical protein